MAAAKQPWWDLVNPVDYFSIYSGLNISEPADFPELRL